MAMRTRCNNPNSTQYKWYGGRGIKVCDRWRTYANFLEDMGHVPPDHSLDRVDGNGNYEPSNCRWATKTVQMRNRRNVRLITYKGVTKTLTEWAKDLGIGYLALYNRVVIRKWSLEDAFERERYASPIREANFPTCPHCGVSLPNWRRPH